MLYEQLIQLYLSLFGQEFKMRFATKATPSKRWIAGAVYRDQKTK